MIHLSPTADLFCKVIDNYGDAGIAWRLACGLAARGFSVRIFIDDPETLGKIHQDKRFHLPLEGGGDTALNVININTQPIEIIHWNNDLPEPITPADLVIDTLEGHAPDAYKTAMAARDPKPVWIYYEHLSAEKWVTDFHLKPSPHPRLQLTQYFFYPGFTPKTGGLLWPDGIQDTTPTHPDNHLKISLFSYRNPGIHSLLGALPRGAVLDVPMGLPVDVIADHLGIEPPAPGTALPHQNATINIIPFMPQGDFPAFLAAHDINFVRGEESITSAILIGKPLIWQIYIQDDDTHMDKLRAFCALYTQDLDTPSATAFTAMNLAWNGHGDVTPAWTDFLTHLPSLTRHARDFAAKTRKLGNAVQNLVDFYTQIR